MTNVHFSHANGFPAKTYQPLFDVLDCCRLTYVSKLGHREIPLNSDIYVLVDELIASIERHQDSPVVGVGHSIGATVTFLAAIKKPELFSKLILLDPSVWCLSKRTLIKCVNKLGIGTAANLSQRALKRRSGFDSVVQARVYFSEKSIFKGFDKRCFDAYLQHALVSCDKGVSVGRGVEIDAGVKLAFDPQVESDIFRCMLLDIPKGASDLKGTVIFGKDSDLFNKKDQNWWAKNIPGFDLISVEGGHLFPLEYPLQTAERINKLMRST